MPNKDTHLIPSDLALVFDDAGKCRVVSLPTCNHILFFPYAVGNTTQGVGDTLRIT